MTLRCTLLAASILGVPLVARAEAISGLYIGAGVGANWLNDTRLRSIDVGSTTLNTGKVR